MMANCEAPAAQFDAQGFAVVRSFFTAEEAAEMSIMVDTYIAENVPLRSAESCFYDEPGNLDSLK